MSTQEIVGLNLAISSLSTICSIWVIIHIFMYMPMQKMVKFYYFIGIAASNTIYSISHLLLLLGDNSTMCIIQNIFNQFGRISSISWFFAIMFILSYSLKNPNLTQKDYIKHVPEIYCLIYGLSGLTLFPFLTQYRNSPQKQIECITNHNYNIRQFIFFYLPLWITILFILYMYIKIRCIAKQGEILRIKYYAMVLIFCFTTPGITVIIDYIAYQCDIYKHKHDYEAISESLLLQIINTICTSSFGVLHAIIFAYTKEVRAQKLCKCLSSSCICKCISYFSLQKGKKSSKQDSKDTSTRTKTWRARNLPSDTNTKGKEQENTNTVITEKSPPVPIPASDRSININLNLNLNNVNLGIGDSFETDIKGSNDNDGEDGHQTSKSDFLYNHCKNSVEQMVQIGIETIGAQLTQSDESLKINCGCLNVFSKS